MDDKNMKREKMMAICERIAYVTGDSEHRVMLKMVSDLKLIRIDDSLDRMIEHGEKILDRVDKMRWKK